METAGTNSAGAASRNGGVGPLVSPWAARRIAGRSAASRVRNGLIAGVLLLGAHGGLAVATASPAAAVYDNDIDNDGLANDAALETDIDGDGLNDDSALETDIDGDNRADTSALETDIDGDGLDDDSSDETDTDGDGVDDDSDSDDDGDDVDDDDDTDSLIFYNIR